MWLDDDHGFLPYNLFGAKSRNQISKELVDMGVSSLLKRTPLHCFTVTECQVVGTKYKKYICQESVTRPLSGRKTDIGSHNPYTAVIALQVLLSVAGVGTLAAKCDGSAALSSRVPNSPEKPETTGQGDESPESVKVVHTIPLGDGWELHRVGITLYQYYNCPFCSKIRVTLDALRIPYQIVEVHPIMKTELKMISSDYRKVPVIVLKNTLTNERVQLRNSADIIRVFLKNCDTIPNQEITISRANATGNPRETEKTKGFYPLVDLSNTGESDFTDWILWVDKCLANLIVLNIYRSYREARQTFSVLMKYQGFNYFSKCAASYTGTFIMIMVQKRMLKKYRVDKGSEREALYDALDMFVDLLGSNKFIGGSTPCEADFNLFGVLQSIDGFETHKGILEHTRIKVYLDNMKTICYIS